MILRGKPLQCEGGKPRVPASNTSYYFQEFWVITPYGGLQENGHGENPNKGICTVPRPQASSKAEVGLYQGQLNLEFGTYPTATAKNTHYTKPMSSFLQEDP